MKMHFAPSRCWSAIHERYNSVLMLGNGTYGVVFKAEVINGEKDKENIRGDRAPFVALKRQSLQQGVTHGVPDTALREMSLLHDLKHQNIVDTLEFSCNENRLYIVMELLDLDLKQYVRKMKDSGTAIPMDQIRKVTYATLTGVRYIHSRGVIHRDLKPHNILVSKDLSKVKLADFGLARAKHAPGKTLTHEVVTLWYRAPEILLGDCVYNESIDIWALGCILAELVIGKPLFAGESELDTVLRIFNLLGTPEESEWPVLAVQGRFKFPIFDKPKKGFLQALSDKMTSDCEDLIIKMLQIDASRRYTAEQCLSHKLFRKIHIPKPKDPRKYLSVLSEDIFRGSDKAQELIQELGGYGKPEFVERYETPPKNIDPSVDDVSTPVYASFFSRFLSFETVRKSVVRSIWGGEDSCDD